MSIFNKLVIKDRQFYKTTVSIAIPISLQNLITTGVNMVDTIMIGTVGESELSAVSLANQFISIYQILCMGIGLGASVLVARYYGMKELNALRKAVSIMIRLCVGIATLFCAVTFFFPEQIMRSYTAEESIITLGIRYLRFSSVTYYLLGLSLTCTIVLRNVGQVRIPLLTSIAAFFINVLANYVFIFGKLGMPAMDVAGAALGTLIDRVFEFTVICGYLFFVDRNISFRLKHLFLKTKDLWKEYIQISIPVLISDGILALGNSSVAMIIGRLGENFVAANAITTVTQQLSTVVIQGFSQASGIVTGITLGEGNRKKAQEQGYALLGIGFLFGVISSLIIMIISGPMIAAYDVSPETELIAEQLMIAISITVLFQATNSIMTKGILRAGGDTRVLMIADNVFLWVASVPLGILAGFVFHLPAFWIYICLKIDQILKAVWCVFRLNSGKWIKKITTGEEQKVKAV